MGNPKDGMVHSVLLTDPCIRKASFCRKKCSLNCVSSHRSSSLPSFPDSCSERQNDEIELMGQSEIRSRISLQIGKTVEAHSIGVGSEDSSPCQRAAEAPDANSEANRLQRPVLTGRLGNLFEFRCGFEIESSAITTTIQVLKPERPGDALGICRHRVCPRQSPQQGVAVISIGRTRHR